MDHPLTSSFQGLGIVLALLLSLFHSSSQAQVISGLTAYQSGTAIVLELGTISRVKIGDLSFYYSQDGGSSWQLINDDCLSPVSSHSIQWAVLDCLGVDVFTGINIRFKALASSCIGTVSFDGYDYRIVEIGNQCWFAENLRTTNYANGDSIPSNLSDADWKATDAGALAVRKYEAPSNSETESQRYYLSRLVAKGKNEEAVYNFMYVLGFNNPNDWIAVYHSVLNSDEPTSSRRFECQLPQLDSFTFDFLRYGRLYNWHAVDDSRSLCPIGWHVPTDDEWKSLEVELGMTSSEVNSNSLRGRGSNLGSQLKSSSDTNPGWTGSNSSGFSALPGGWRSEYGDFGHQGGTGFWWSSSSLSTSGARGRVLGLTEEGVGRGTYPFNYGFSVRCLRDD